MSTSPLAQPGAPGDPLAGLTLDTLLEEMASTSRPTSTPSEVPADLSEKETMRREAAALRRDRLNAAMVETVGATEPVATASTTKQAAPLDDQLQMPDGAIYGDWLRETIAKMEGIPSTLYLCLLTIFAGLEVRVHYSDDIRRIIPRLYTMVLGGAGAGKSTLVDDCLNVVLRATGTDKDFVRTGNFQSHRAFDATFPPETDPLAKGNHKVNPLVHEVMAPCFIHLQDEAAMLMATINTPGGTGSKTAFAYTELFYKAYGCNRDSKGLAEYAVKYNYLGCLVCPDPDIFSDYFCGVSTGGLYDRFAFATPPPPEYRFDATKGLPPIPHHFFKCFELGYTTPSLVQVQRSDFALIDEWASKVPQALYGRVPELAKRVAIISAAINNDTTITPECVQAALAFAKWQVKVRKVYKPNLSQNEAGAMASKIIEAFEIEARKNPKKFVKFHDLSRKYHWQDKRGHLATSAKKSLIADGYLIKMSDEADCGRYRLSYNPDEV